MANYGGGKKKSGLELKEDNKPRRAVKKGGQENGGGGGGESGRYKKKESLFPGTAKQLLSASLDTRGHATISGQTLDDVTIVGKVSVVEDVGDSTCLAFKLSDETGDIPVRLVADYDVSVDSDPNVQPNKIIRVFGAIKSNSKAGQSPNIYLHAHMVRLADDGEPAFHKAEAEVHRRRLAGTLLSSENEKENATSNNKGKENVATSDGKEKDVASVAMASFDSAVMAALEHGRSSDHGMSAEDVSKKDPKLPVDDVRTSLSRLANEGSIYTTTDEKHFKLTV